LGSPGIGSAEGAVLKTNNPTLGTRAVTSTEIIGSSL
jgi:hypothetical protein